MTTLVEALVASPDRMAIQDTEDGWTVIVASHDLPSMPWSLFFTNVNPRHAWRSDSVRARNWTELYHYVNGLGGELDQGWLPITP